MESARERRFKVESDNYERLAVIPGSREKWLELRSNNLNSTDISSLFGINPYTSPFELWHQKKGGVVVEVEENERMFWGGMIEDSIARGYAEKYGVEVKKNEEYISIPELRLGSTFDYIRGDGTINIEIKNVDGLEYKEKWEDDEAPVHIELQVQHQMLVNGVGSVTIVALVAGNRLEIIRRKADPAVHEAILVEAAKFWKSIDENNPPPPNYDVDMEQIRLLAGKSTPDMTLHADEKIAALALEFKTVSDACRLYDGRKKAIVAELLHAAGDAERIQGDGWHFSTKWVEESYIEAHTRRGYRNVRYYEKKDKGKRGK